MEVVHDEDLQGQCYIVHARDTDTIDEWVKHDDHYYVNQQTCSLKPKSLDDLQNWPKNEFKSCKKCHEEREDLLERQSILLQRHGRLRGLELFSGKAIYTHVLLSYRRWSAGAGGLGTGFDLSGFVETRWAIEFSPGAARTYR